MLAVTDVPTPAAPLLRDLTISSSRGSAGHSGAAKLGATWDGYREPSVAGPGAPRAEVEEEESAPASSKSK